MIYIYSMAFSEIAPFIKPENRTTGIQQFVSVILDNYIVYQKCYLNGFEAFYSK